MSGLPATTKLTERFEKALIYAIRLHAKQIRKTHNIPYVAHLLGVVSLVLEDGGTEDEAIAALLHDAVEDQGGRKVLVEIEHRYGECVAEIVDGCTDAYHTPKPPWRERKEKFIERLTVASAGVLRVSLADKLHNGRAIIADLRSQGDGTWEKFNGGKAGTLWYYRTLVPIYQARFTGFMVEELSIVVEEMNKLAEEDET